MHGQQTTQIQNTFRHVASVLTVLSHPENIQMPINIPFENNWCKTQLGSCTKFRSISFFGVTSHLRAETETHDTLTGPNICHVYLYDLFTHKRVAKMTSPNCDNENVSVTPKYTCVKVFAMFLITWNITTRSVGLKDYNSRSLDFWSIMVSTLLVVVRYCTASWWAIFLRHWSRKSREQDRSASQARSMRPELPWGFSTWSEQLVSSLSLQRGGSMKIVSCTTVD